MRTRCLVWVLIGLLVLPVLSFAQRPQIPKTPLTGKTYWCAEVEDILFHKEPQQGEKLGVYVRVKFKSQTVIPGAPGQKRCNCAFEGPADPTKFWSKTMSLRLIGVKYSETETNLLEYQGPTPSFPIYNYSGFQVIGFMVTENDLKRGYIDLFGWSTKEPLPCRDSAIYATLDVNGYALKRDDDPDYLQKGCFPHPDFVKKFKPKCLQLPKIPAEVIKKGFERAGETVKQLPDLKITSAEIFPKISKKENEQAIIYDEASIKINILNSGKSDVSKFKLKIERKWEGSNAYHPEDRGRYDVGYYYADKWHSIKSGDVKDGIIEIEDLQANGGYRAIWIYVDNSLAPRADCWFRVTLDPENEVLELDESNNQISEIFFPSHYLHPEMYKRQ